ncbi:MAG TPA: AI-2E family transporter [Rhizomicrobium sp.]|nr:AI-2E family transporter [Rhizomicrobium sp.]
MSSAAVALREPLRAKFTAALAAASAVAALYVGRPVLVPLSLALLIALALSPVVDALKRWNVKLLPAVLATMALAATLLASIALFLAGQFAELTEAAPVHRVPLLGEPAIAAGIVEPLLNPLASAGAAILFAAVLLINRDRLAVHIAPVAAAAQDFGEHLLAQGVLDLGFGVAVALGLWAIGVPNFGLWALLGVMLRSVPFVGVAVAALCPLLLTGEPTPLIAAETFALFLAVDGALHLAQRHWLRPRKARLSAFAAVAATILWTCLWGLTGLLLAVPLTLGVALFGRRFQSLRFLDRLLVPSSRETAAPPKPDTALDDLAAARHALDTAADAPPPSSDSGHAICIAGPGPMDEAAAGLLAGLLQRKGLDARVVSFAETAPAELPRLALAGAWAVCFSATDANDAAALRQLVRRVRPRLRSARMIAGLWGWDGDALMDLRMAECDLVATRLNEAAERIERLAREEAEARRIAQEAA